jgi:histone deacetylase 1/2
VDECVFFRNNVIFIVYVDDGIFASPSQKAIDQAIKELKQRFDMEDQGSITDYLGVNVEHLPNGDIKLSQPHLIDQIIDEVHISKRIAGKQTPAAATKILRRDETAPSFDQRFNYRRAVGKLNFLEKSTRPDISYATHQVARFSEDPKASHGEAIEHIVKYLRDTRNDGIILRPVQDKSFEIFADADFVGNWHRITAPDDPSTAKSRSGYVINYAGCPIAWASKLQTIIALSSTEAEYVSLSEALRDTIPLMDLINEFKDNGFKVYSEVPRVHCKAFEDNSGALELARLPKLRPRTKHINIKYHHFREHVRLGLIKVYPIGTNDQIADIFTKPLAQNLFLKFRKKLLHF